MKARRASRFAWSIGDQAISSVSNLLLSVLVARVVSADDFGAFAVAFATYQVMLGVSRAVVGEPTLIRSGKQAGVGQPLSPNGVLGSSLALGVVAALAALGVGLVTNGPISVAFTALAIGLPWLMLLDGLRYWEFAHSRPHVAAVLDCTWLSVQLGALLVFTLLGNLDLWILTLTWAGGAAAGSIAYMVRFRAYPSPAGAVQWFRANSDMSPRFLGEDVTISGIQQGIVYFTVAFAGLAAAGSLRSAQVIMGPMNMVSMGLAVVVLPALSRRASTAVRTLPPISLATSLTFAISVAIYALVVSMIPAPVGEWLLGDSWAGGLDVLGLVAALLAVNGLSYGATAGLRALEAIRASFRLRVTTAPLVLGLVALGALMGGLPGALVGAVCGSAVQCLAWWLTYMVLWRRSVTRNDRLDRAKEKKAMESQLGATVITQVGPDPEGIGGMETVLRAYRDAHWEELQMDVVASWRQGGKRARGKVFRHALRELSRQNLPAGRRVHVHMSHRGSFVREGFILRYVAGRNPVFVTIHGSNFVKSAGGALWSRLYRSVLRRSSGIAVLNTNALEVVERMNLSIPIRILPNPGPVTIEATQGPGDKRRPKAVFAGAVGYRKGVDILLDAWAEVRKAVPDAELVIIGPSDARSPEIAERARGYAIGPRNSREVQEAIGEAAVAVLPSRGEAMPMFLIEAMGLGVPMVVTDVGAMPELARDAGIVVGVGDARALADALITLLSNPTLARKLGDRGLESYRAKYSAQIVERNLVDFYGASGIE